MLLNKAYREYKNTVHINVKVNNIDWLTICILESNMSDFWFNKTLALSIWVCEWAHLLILLENVDVNAYIEKKHRERYILKWMGCCIQGLIKSFLVGCNEFATDETWAVHPTERVCAKYYLVDVFNFFNPFQHYLIFVRQSQFLHSP